VYHTYKDLKKGLRRFYQPHVRHEGSCSLQSNHYTTEFLKSIGIVAEYGDTEHAILDKHVASDTQNRKSIDSSDPRLGEPRARGVRLKAQT